MLMRLGVRLAVFLLKSGNLSTDDAVLCTGAILNQLSATPYRGIIEIVDQQLVINGLPLDIEQAIRLRHNALAALDNAALKLVREQVAFVAVTHGMHKAETATQILWGRVGLWWFQQELEYLELLAQRNQQPALSQEE